MRHYVLDSKFDGDFDDWPGRVVSEDGKSPSRPGNNERYQVWQPVELIPEEIEKWLYQVRKDAPAILMIDELEHLVYARNLYSKEYNLIKKTGRSLPIGTITLSQELSRIPPNAYKQARHRLGFYLEKANNYDRMVRNQLLKSEVDDPIHEYGVYYQHERGRGEPQYYQSIQHFFGYAGEDAA
jgi:hypothetical protein